MTNPLFNLKQTNLAIQDSNYSFPIHRIYCVGQNYAAHAIEMGGDPFRNTPFFFSKPADAACQSTNVPWPSKTDNLHHEVELVVALDCGGTNLTLDEASQCIFGYAVGVDLTRRDLQAAAKAKGRPWDTAKGFDYSAPISNIISKDNWQFNDNKKISLSVNGVNKQEATLEQLIWNIPELIKELSSYYSLCAGDLIFTGTPAGVGQLQPDDKIQATIEGLPDLSFTFFK